MTSKENAKEIRTAMRGLFGKSETSVTIGRGTSRSWVECTIEIEPATGCSCQPDAYGRRYDCPECTSKYKTTGETAHALIEQMKRNGKIKPATFSSDDGFGEESDCILIQVRFKK